MVQRAAPERRPGIPASRQRGEAKKDSIRRAALRLFQQRGFRKVTIREIAHEADVSQVTIYNYFGSKEGLIRDVASRLVLDVTEEFRALMADERPFPEKLEDIVLGKMKLAGQYGGELMERLMANDPRMQEHVRRTYDRQILPLLASFFEEGKRQGYVNPALSTEAILSYTEIFRPGLTARPGMLTGSQKPAGLVRDLTTLYFYGLMGRAAPRSPRGMKGKGKGTEWPVTRLP